MSSKDPISNRKHRFPSVVNLKQHVSNKDPYHINDMGLGQSTSDGTCVVVELKSWEPPEISSDIDINKIPPKNNIVIRKFSYEVQDTPSMESKECSSRITSENPPLPKDSFHKDEVHAMKPPVHDTTRRMLMKCNDKLVAEPVPNGLCLTVYQ